MDGMGSAIEPIHQEEEQENSFNMGDFLGLHEQFMTVKRLAGLATKTLSDHITFMRYLKNWLQSEVQDYENHAVEKGVFLQYIAYLFIYFRKNINHVQ